VLLTVTLNAALDITYRVPVLRPSRSHRVSEVAERPGGKGLNVARVLAALGHDVMATGFAGGGSGEALRRQLARTIGFVDAIVPVAGTTRRTVTVLDASNGAATLLNEPGPVITPAEWSSFRETFENLVHTSSAVALCGSLPPGVPMSAYAQLIRVAQAAGVPVLLDASGEPLRRGVAARPDIIKPNADELAELTGSHDPFQGARSARGRGAQTVVTSLEALGTPGVLVSSAEGQWQAAAPRSIQGNPTGAGDSAVAGILSGLVEGLSWPRILTRAAALSAATVAAPVAGEFDRAVYEDLLERITVIAGPTGT
jgi:tagatose 6-phosphate kinase